MSLRFTRGAMVIALAMSFGLVAIPACNKKKKAPPPAETPDPAPNTSPPSNSEPTYGFRDYPDPPIGPLFSTTTEAPFRIASEKNIEQIVLAMTQFHDTYKAFPGGYADKTGKPGLSWRVALLPYLEEDNLFKQFKLDEPWNSDHNKKLIAMMPRIYSPSKQTYGGYTFYRGFTGPNAWLPARTGKAGEMLFGVRTAEITDGTSHTILVAEAANAVIWTKPDEIVFTRGTAPKLGGGVFSSGFCAGMADGHTVKFVRKFIDAQSIANAIDINEDKPVNLDN